MLSRHYIANKHVETVRTFAPQALLVFDTVDLHFLRAERLAELEGGAMAKAAARAKREEELALIRRADVTLVVSADRAGSPRGARPRGARCAVLSNIHEPMPIGKPFADREGLVFIGGFQHPPNTDAMLWYAQDVLPHVRRLLPGVRTYVIGADAPATIRDLAAEDFVVTGHVPDVAPYFTRARASISPLRYGAGVKGKVNLALSYGVPVVATTPSIEGMHLTPGADVLVADTAEAFADAIAQVYRDEMLWHRMSDGGRAIIRQHFSRDVARAALAALLARAHRRAPPAPAEGARQRRVKSRSRTPWPRPSPRFSNFVRGRHAGRSAKSLAVLASSVSALSVTRISCAYSSQSVATCSTPPGASRRASSCTKPGCRRRRL